MPIFVYRYVRFSSSFLPLARTSITLAPLLCTVYLPISIGDQEENAICYTTYFEQGISLLTNMFDASVQATEPTLDGNDQHTV